MWEVVTQVGVCPCHCGAKADGSGGVLARKTSCTRSAHLRRGTVATAPAAATAHNRRRRFGTRASSNCTRRSPHHTSRRQSSLLGSCTLLLLSRGAQGKAARRRCNRLRHRCTRAYCSSTRPSHRSSHLQSTLWGNHISLGRVVRVGSPRSRLHRSRSPQYHSQASRRTAHRPATKRGTGRPRAATWVVRAGGGRNRRRRSRTRAHCSPDSRTRHTSRRPATCPGSHRRCPPVERAAS